MVTEQDTEYEEPEEQEESRRRWLPWVVLAIIIALVLWLLWMYGGWRGGDERDASSVEVQALVTVPDLVGIDGEDAERLVEGLGLKAEMLASYDTVGDPGTVSDQSPKAGAQVREGTTIEVWVIDVSAAGTPEETERPDYAGEERGITSRPGRTTEMAPVPQLVGLSEAEAIRRIEAAGFEARPMYQERPWGDHMVEQQAPPAGEWTEEGFQIHLFITIPPGTD